VFPIAIAALALALPPFDPSNFVDRVDNPYLPLTPGSVYRYEGSKDGKRALDVVKITRTKKNILGVNATVVSDRLYLNGKLEERTSDWYAQDKSGNVWYLGEDTAELDPNGKVKSTEGSWETGVNGARPGIFMPPHPRVGDGGLQEFYKGHAEDHFRVLTTRARVKTSFVSSTRALRTKEWTPLEPGVVTVKYYVRGIGPVMERDVKGGNEFSQLVSFRKG
jgi:hypothetical protein